MNTDGHVGAVVSLHDVHPTREDECRELVRMIERRDIRATLLVVPGRWRGVSLGERPAFVGWLHEAATRGHEIAMHGWTHTVDRDRPAAARNPRNRLLARGCAEFVDLAESAAQTRLERGLWAMAELGFAPRGFTPPGWLASPGTIAALRRLGFEYTTSQTTVHDLSRDVRLRMPAVCQRADSPLAPIGTTLVRRLVVRRVVRRRPVRLAVHPADLTHPDLLAATEQLLDIVGCVPTFTYADVVAGATRPSARAS